jgi:ATP-dependent Clp protease adaptor protein ClpS
MATKDPPKNPPGGPPGKTGKPDRDGGTGTQTLERTKTKKPQLYRVVMHNDDYTTQEFVVHVLITFFKKDPTEAQHLMLKVHMTGKAIVAVYTKDIAETKVAQVTDYAREQGHPLMVTMEPDT